MKRLLPVFIAALLSFASCELYEYGKLGGADQTNELRPGSDTGSEFEERMSFLSGVWYSHYAGIGRLDGYRIGRWGDFEIIMGPAKLELFPGLQPFTYTSQTGSDTPGQDDFFVFYDGTVYGQKDDGIGGNGGWGGLGSGYIGIVRAVNIFNNDPDRGAVIIEYLEGCAPAWDPDIRDGQRPFFGIYYRVLKPDTVQMANAVDLAALYKGKKYYTETVTLDEAIVLNTVENEAEFIAWGVVIPQDREK
jgi:hypothetical protein